jgi:membrane protease YdiL (CAAX protease family)
MAKTTFAWMSWLSASMIVVGWIFWNVLPGFGFPSGADANSMSLPMGLILIALAAFLNVYRLRLLKGTEFGRAYLDHHGREAKRIQSEYPGRFMLVVTAFFVALLMPSLLHDPFGVGEPKATAINNLVFAVSLLAVIVVAFVLIPVRAFEPPSGK